MSEASYVKDCTGALRVVAVVAALALSACATTGGGGQRAYATPEAASRALIAALEKNDPAALIQVLGPGSEKQINGANWAARSDARTRMAEAASDMYSLREISPTEIELTLGVDRKPFPMHLLLDDRGWRFDTSRGMQGVVYRLPAAGADEVATSRSSRSRRGTAG